MYCARTIIVHLWRSMCPRRESDYKRMPHDGDEARGAMGKNMTSTLLPLPSFIKDHLVVPSTSTSLHLGSSWWCFDLLTHPSPSLFHSRATTSSCLRAWSATFRRISWKGCHVWEEHAHKILDKQLRSQYHQNRRLAQNPTLKEPCWNEFVDPRPRARHSNCIGPASPLTPITVHSPFITANMGSCHKPIRILWNPVIPSFQSSMHLISFLLQVRFVFVLWQVPPWQSSDLSASVEAWKPLPLAHLHLMSESDFWPKNTSFQQCSIHPLGSWAQQRYSKSPRSWGQGQSFFTHHPRKPEATSMDMHSWPSWRTKESISSMTWQCNKESAAYTHVNKNNGNWFTDLFKICIPSGKIKSSSQNNPKILIAARHAKVPASGEILNFRWWWVTSSTYWGSSSMLSLGLLRAIFAWFVRECWWDHQQSWSSQSVI